MEEVVELVGLGLLHRLGEFVFLHVLVAYEIDFLDLDLLALVHVEVHLDGVLHYGIALYLRRHLALEEALFGEVALDDVDGGLLHVLGELAPALEVRTLLDVLALTRLHAGIAPTGHARPLLNFDCQPGSVGLGAEAVYFHGNVIEELLEHQPLDHIGDFFSRHGDGAAGAYPGLGDYHLLLEIGIAFHPDTADHILLRSVVVHLHVSALGAERKHCCKHQGGNCKFAYDSHNLQI